jgi:outer membrane protein TolC
LPANTALAQLPPAPAGIDSKHAYTLPELIDIAQSNNLSTRIAWAEARNAALTAGIAKSAYLPNISAIVVGGYQTGRSSNGALGLHTNNNETVKGTISALSLQWLLFDFGKRAAVVEAAEQLSVISNIAFTASHQQVIYKVSLAFYAKAAADARLQTAQQALKNTLDVEAASEARLKQGVGTVVETALARQASAQARFDLVAAESAAQDAYSALMAAIGISPLTTLKTADLSLRPLSPAMAEPIDHIVAAALARRPDILSAHAAQQASLANLRAAEAEFLPKLFLSTTGSYTEGGLETGVLPGIAQLPPTVNLSGTKLGATAFIGLHIPLYDGGTREALLAQARSNVGKSDAMFAQVRDEAMRQIVSAGNTAKSSLAAYDAARALVAATQTSYDAALAAYKRGVGNITAVTTAETQLLRARFAETNAYSGALSAAASLALSAGALGAAPDQ